MAGTNRLPACLHIEDRTFTKCGKENLTLLGLFSFPSFLWPGIGVFLQISGPRMLAETRAAPINARTSLPSALWEGSRSRPIMASPPAGQPVSTPLAQVSTDAIGLPKGMRPVQGPRQTEVQCSAHVRADGRQYRLPSKRHHLSRQHIHHRHQTDGRGGADHPDQQPQQPLSASTRWQGFVIGNRGMGQGIGRGGHDQWEWNGQQQLGSGVGRGLNESRGT